MCNFLYYLRRIDELEGYYKTLNLYDVVHKHSTLQLLVLFLNLEKKKT